MTRCVHLWQGHTVRELLRRLKAQFPRDGGGGDGPLSRADLDLTALGVAAAWHFRSAPSVHCMLGPLAARVKARAKQKPRVRQRLADQVRPVDVQVGPPSGPTTVHLPHLLHSRHHALIMVWNLTPCWPCVHGLKLTLPLHVCGAGCCGRRAAAGDGGEREGDLGDHGPVQPSADARAGHEPQQLCADNRKHLRALIPGAPLHPCIYQLTSDASHRFIAAALVVVSSGQCDGGRFSDARTSCSSGGRPLSQAASLQVKEGKVGIDRGPDGVGWQVRRIEDAAAANSAAVDQERTQLVVRLDREEWGLWRAHVRQQDCLMKVRVAPTLAIVRVSMTIIDST